MTNEEQEPAAAEFVPGKRYSFKDPDDKLYCAVCWAEEKCRHHEAVAKSHYRDSWWMQPEVCLIISAIFIVLNIVYYFFSQR